MATATLAGVPLIGSPSWVSKSGTSPAIQDFEIAATTADTLQAYADSHSPVSLVFTNETTGKTTTWSRLFILAILAGPNPHIAVARVADARIWWPHKIAVRNYNMRRRVGYFRPDDLAAVQLLPTDEDVWYWPRTLKNGKPWTAYEILTDLIAVAHKAEALTGFPGPTTIDASGVDFGQLRVTKPNGVEVDDPADKAIDRALGYMPGIAISLDQNGRVRLQDKSLGREAGLVAAMGAAKGPMRGNARMTPFRAQCPKEYHVLFSRIVEVRFDFIEDGTDDISIPDSADHRFAANVVETPDWQTTISGKTHVQGSYVQFDDWLAALGTAPGITEALTQSYIRKAMIPYMDLWAGLQQTGILEPDGDWPGRITAIQQHWRRTLKLPDRWVEGASSIEPVRVATVNPEQGTRARSVVFCDTCSLPTQKTLLRSALTGQSIPMARNVYGYPQGANGAYGVPPLSDDTKPAPAQVLVADSDQGILHVTFNAGINANYSDTLPGILGNCGEGNLLEAGIERQRVPGQATHGNAVRTIAFNGWFDSEENMPALASGFKMALIVSMVPAVPNDERRLHRVVVKPGDVADRLPPSIMDTIRQDARGPIREIRIHPRVEMARTAWRDSMAKEIAEAFGVGGSANDAQTIEKLSDTLRPLTVNDAPQSIIGDKAASLQEIAKATAAREWQRHVRRYTGRIAADFNGDILPTGQVDEVEHSVGEDGEMTTSVVFPDVLDQLDFISMVDAGTRAVLLREVKDAR